MDWFEAITGFREQTYEATQAKLSVVDGRLRSTESDRACAVGQFETPTLAELRQRTYGLIAGQGPSRVSCLQGDASTSTTTLPMRMRCSRWPLSSICLR